MHYDLWFDTDVGNVELQLSLLLHANLSDFFCELLNDIILRKLIGYKL